MKKPLIVLTGPTAAGKTHLSIALAKTVNGEIISADSMQVYREMDIGSAKIRPEEMDGVPHHLVDAFKSTLEEAKYADYIIHVVDCSNPQAEQQMEVVYDTLHELEVQGKKTITLFNKVDVGAAIRMRDSMADHTLKVSAKTGEGLDELKALLGKILSEEQIYVEKLFGYQEAGKIQLIREYGQLLSEEYTDSGIMVKARVPQEIHGKIM